MSEERKRYCCLSIAGIAVLVLTNFAPVGYVRGILWGLGVGLCVPNWIDCLVRWFYPAAPYGEEKESDR
jgi:hypothetical protein